MFVEVDISLGRLGLSLDSFINGDSERGAGSTRDRRDSERLKSRDSPSIDVDTVILDWRRRRLNRDGSQLRICRCRRRSSCGWLLLGWRDGTVDSHDDKSRGERTSAIGAIRIRFEVSSL